MADYFIDPGIIFDQSLDWAAKGKQLYQTAVKYTYNNGAGDNLNGKWLLINGEIYEANGLSWEARGMLAYHYVRKPKEVNGRDGTVITTEELVSLSPDSPEAVKSIVAEIRKSVFSNRFICE
ncbi:MAG: hypothetical protein ACOX8W_03490 [bacterium]